MIKKLTFFLTLSVFCGTFVRGQVWLEAGLKASIGPSGYLNTELAGADNFDYDLNMAFNYGAALGLNFGDYHGLNFELLAGTYYQDMLQRMDGSTLRHSLEWEVLDLYALYRYYPESGYYLELGPKYTTIQAISQTQGVNPVNINGQYEKGYLSGVFGVGAFLAGTEALVFKSGLRFEYGLDDLVSADGMANGFPIPGSGLADSGSTTPFRVSFGLELSFGVGGVAKSACGRRGFVFGSRYRR